MNERKLRQVQAYESIILGDDAAKLRAPRTEHRRIGDIRRNPQEPPELFRHLVEGVVLIDQAHDEGDARFDVLHEVDRKLPPHAVTRQRRRRVTFETCDASQDGVVA